MKDAYICKHSYLPMTVADMQVVIFANERCRYMQVFIFANSYANMHGPMQVWKPRAYLLPLSKCTPAQRIRKTAFLKHPRRFGLQVSINIPVSKFFSPIYICVRLRRVLMPSYIYLMCVCPCFLNVLFRQKRYEDNIWLGQGMLRMAKRRILFYSWEVFFSSQNWLQSLNFLWLWKTT